MASQLDIMNRATRIANAAGIDPHQSAIIDNPFLAEDLFSMALRAAIQEAAKTPSKRGALKRNYSLTIASGVATLPDSVFDDYLSDSALAVAGDASALTSYEPRYEDYLRAEHMYGQIGYYTFLGSQILYRAPKEAAGSSSASVVLTAVGMPDIPTLLTDALAITSDIAERTAVLLAQMMRGTLQQPEAPAE